MFIVYTGNGKGKTTAALGLAWRVLGYNKKVIFAQFLKGLETGEVRLAKRFKKNLFLYLEGNKYFLTSKFKKPSDKKLFLKIKQAPSNEKERAKLFFDFIIKETHKKNPFLLILDEINLCFKLKLLDVDYALKKIDLLTKNLKDVNIVFTGRYAPKKVKERADLITEMKEVKHPFQKGRLAQKAIDF